MLRRVGILTVLPVLFLSSSLVIAEENEPAATEKKPQTYSERMQHYITQLKPVSTYAGIGLFDDMLNANVETVTDMGNFYLRVGKFMESHAGMAVNAGWRYPITGERDESGYFMGVFLGQVIASSYTHEDELRNGIGFDLSYQWVNDHTRKTISVGLGTGFSEEVEHDSNEPAQPKAFFSFSTALKVF